MGDLLKRARRDSGVEIIVRPELEVEAAESSGFEMLRAVIEKIGFPLADRKELCGEGCCEEGNQNKDKECNSYGRDAHGTWDRGTANFPNP